MLALVAHAWGPQGHEVVATLAQARLTTRAQAEIDKLLALESGATLASISNWADEQRSPLTAAWHYVNFPKNTCTYDPARDCPDGSCVVGAINRQLAILGSAAPPEERLMALKYVVHLVGDIHQPLHAGHAEDRGELWAQPGSIRVASLMPPTSNTSPRSWRRGWQRRGQGWLRH